MSDKPEEETPEVPAEEVPADLLAMIKREDGSQKYDSIPSALSSLAASEEFIQDLKKQNEELNQELEAVREQAAKNVVMEDILDKLNKTTEVNEQPEQPSESEVGTPDLQNLVEAIVAQREQAQTEKANQQKVFNALMSSIGDTEKARKHFADKAKELGVGETFLTDLAGKSPSSALKLLELEDSKSARVEPKSTVNTEAQPKTPTSEYRTIMGASTTKDVNVAWEESAKKVLADLQK